MNTFKKLASTLVLCLSLTACNDLSSPEGVLGTAFRALQKEKVKTFKRTLRGDALEQYGSIVGMAEIINELQPLDVKLGETQLVRTELDGAKFPTLRVFEVELLARQKSSQSADYSPFRTVAIECDVSYHYEFNPNWDYGSGCYQAPGGTFCRDYPRSPYPPIRREAQRCYITNVVAR